MARTYTRSSGGWRDSTGRALEDYPRPSLAVDTALLTIDPEAAQLAVVVWQRPDTGQWGLPGTFLHEGERLQDAVRRSLADKCGVHGVSPRQLKVFDDPKRDSRGWVLSAAHVATVPHEKLAAMIAGHEDVDFALLDRSKSGRFRMRLPGGQRRASTDHLPFDHDEIIHEAAEDLRRRYSEATDPDGLVPQPFTIPDLQAVHSVIEGHDWHKDAFRRRVEPQLRPSDEIRTGVVGRPARLYYSD